MGNYLRIYKDLDEFKSNAFNLPYPCVSVVDDDTIETDEEIVEFEQLDKLSFKVEVPLENTSTECVNVASFSNPISVEGYSINGGDAVFIDLPQLIDTTQEIDWVYQNINGSDMYAPSYDNHMLISDLNSDLKIKTNRPINEDDFLFMSLGLGGQVADGMPIPVTELNGALIMEEPTVYKFHSDFLAELKNEFSSQFPQGTVICFAFVDNGYVIGSGQTKPSITTSVGALAYETELKETKVEFVFTEVNGSSMYLPSDNYLFDVLSIDIDTRIKISRALIESDYVLMMTTFDGQTDVQFAPLTEMPLDMLLVQYSETEYGFSQDFIDSIASDGAPSGAKIGLYFVDKGYIVSETPTIPTIDNYVMVEVTVGGLTNLCVPSEEIPSDGVVEVRMKATNDLNSISFVDKQNLKSFDGSRYGLNNIKEISSKQFESSDKLEEFIIPNGVETVGDFAFNNCFSLSSVTIPESVTEIGAKAFRKCMFLSENFINQSSLDAEANNYWKANVYDVIQEDGLCIRGTSVWGCRPNSSGVTIPDYITRIEENAFIGCTNLKRVDMPNSIKYIGKNAFRYCINVEKVVIPESVEEIASDAFTYCFFDLDVFENKSNINAKDNNYWQAVICKDGCVSSCGILLYISGENIVIHDGIKMINADAVRNRESIKSIIIPNSVTSIDNYAFNGCTSLTSITIPSSVTSIGSSAFTYCTSLSSIVIPSSVIEIDSWTFYGCSSLTSVTIPDSVTHIDSNAFGGCTNLNYIKIPDSVIHIDSNAFSNCVFQSDKFIYNRYENAEFNDWWGAKIYDIVQEDGLYISGTTAITCDQNATNVTIPNSVTTIGNQVFQNCTSLTSITIPNSVTKIEYCAFENCSSLTSITIPDSVTEIGDYTFYKCSGLTSIEIPSNVTNIGSSAFTECTNLTSVTIPNSVTEIGNYVFRNCTSLTSITIPNSVTSIGIYAFYKCSGLTSIVIPSSVTNIGYAAFYGCSSLSSVTIPDSVTSIGNNAFYNCSGLTSIVIPDGITSIDSSAFSNCSSLTSVTIPSSVTKICSWAFNSCSSLTSITIPDNITYIELGAFQDCRSLTSIVIPDNITIIGNQVFQNCTSLTSIEIPDSVTTIGNFAFRDCSTLTSVTIPSSVTEIGNQTFSGCYFQRDRLVNNSSANGHPWSAKRYDVIQDDGLCINGTTAADCRPNATNVTIPNGVTSIANYALEACTSLTSITIPDSVTTIGNDAFSGCTNLTSVKIPDSVTNIGNSAFNSCSSLSSVTIPSSITSIASSAFTECSSLTSIIIPDSITSIGNNAFEGCSCLTSVTIGSGVTSIGNAAFRNCTSLTSITIPDSVTTIGNFAFSNCSSLTSVTIPSSVTSIEYGAFGSCYFQRDKLVNNSSVSNYPWAAILYDTIQDDGLCISGTTAVKCRPNATNITIPSSVTSISSSAFQNCSSLTSIVIPDSVTSIGFSAFRNCSSLTSVTIPSSVTSISDYTFDGCSSLTSIVIPSSVTSISYSALNGCSSLTSVTIPNGVINIASSTFSHCSGLTSIVIPDSVTSIGDYAFYYCSSLSSITIPNSVTSIDSSTFEGTPFYNNLPNGEIYLGSCYYKYKGTMPINTSITIKDGTKSICNNAFSNYSNLTSIVIPSSVTSIGHGAFRNCSNLNSIVIPSSVTSIGNNAFSGCEFDYDKFINNIIANGYPWGATIYQEDGLCIDGATVVDCKLNAVHVTIPDSVTEIGYAAFSGCTSLTSIVIPDSVTSIGDYAFQYCSGLTSIVIPDSVTSISYKAFNGCTSLTSVIIPDSITTINENTFQNCSSLTSVTIPSSVTEIDRYAFSSCSSLSSVTIGSSVTSICDYAFENCSSLNSIVIPSSVTSIGNLAFYGCYFQHDKLINNSNFSSSYPWNAKICDIIQDDGLCISGTTAIKCRPNATSIVIPSSVTSIGEHAFNSCSSLSSVVIPDSVTSIGNNAFYNCSGLTSIVIPSSVTNIGSSAFTYCTSLSSVTIPDSVTSISRYAFYNCSGLTSIVIPDGITSIDYYALRNCLSLSSVTIPDSVTSISQYAFENCTFHCDKFINNSSASGYPWNAKICDIIQDDGLCISGTTAVDCRPNATNVTIPSSVTSIGEHAFNSCSSLSSVVIPDSVIEIGYAAFAHCTSLTSVTIPNSVTSIDDDAFYNCTSLNSIVIPDSVTRIGEDAFAQCNISIYNNTLSGAKYVGKILYDWVKPNNNNTNYIHFVKNGCIKLGEKCLMGATNYLNVVIPDSVTEIGYAAFSGCTSLTSIVIPDNVTSIGNGAFRNCTNLYNAEIGDNVTSIGQYTFYACNKLDSVHIGSSVTSIGDYAFSGCTQLSEVCIKEGLETIGDSAFANSQLCSITLPSTIKNINRTCFYNCINLREIICNATIAPTVSSSFSKLPANGTLYVPHGSDYSSWKSKLPSGWVIKYLYEPKECTNLVITANDVNGRQTKAQVSYTATTNGINPITNKVMNDVIVTGVTKSQSFEQNTSYTDTIEREITFEYFGVTASTTITQGVWFDASYSIDLQDQWRLSSAVQTPDSSLYDGVYESFSNYNVNSSSATCVVTIDGYSDFKFYIRSNGESHHDYVDVYDLDGSSTIKATTKGIANSGITLSSYTLVEFTNLDGGEHTIKVVYKKDSSSNSGTDRGYLMIPYNQDE